MRQFSRTVARNSAFGFGAQMAMKVLSFLFSVLIVRNLGAESFGQYAAVLAFGALFVFLSDLGLSPYTVREIARLRDAPDGQQRAEAMFSNVLLLRFILSIITAVLLIGTAYFTDRPLVMVGAIALGTLGLIMYSLQGTSESMLAGFERLDLTARSRVAERLTFVVLGGLALWFGLGYYGLIYANLAGIAVLTYICWRGIRTIKVGLGHIDPSIWLRLLRASLPFGLIGFTLGLSYKFDSVLLNIYRGDKETGYYNAAYSLIFSMTMLSNVLNTSLFPSLTRHAANAPEELPRIYERCLRYLLILALPLSIGIWALADQLVPLLYKETYIPAIPALKIVIWVVPLMFASEFLGYVVLVAGQEHKVARSVMISTGLNVAVNLFMVPRFGFIGAAIMTVITEAVLVGQYLWLLRDTTSKFNWGHLFVRPLVAAGLMGALAIGLERVLPLVFDGAFAGVGSTKLVSALQQGLPLAITAALCAVVYIALLVLFGVIGQTELDFVRNLRASRRNAQQPVATIQPEVAP